MKAFVTGGTGFVGAHLVQQLLADGVAVTCLVRSPAKAEALGWRGVRTIRGDMSDRRALAEGCAGADVIFHVAGLIVARDLDHFMSANRDATGTLLEDNFPIINGLLRLGFRPYKTYRVYDRPV